MADCQWLLWLPWDMAWARVRRRRAICAGAQARQQHRARSTEGSAGAGAVAGAGGARREAARNITDAWAQGGAGPADREARSQQTAAPFNTTEVDGTLAARQELLGAAIGRRLTGP